MLDKHMNSLVPTLDCMIIKAPKLTKIPHQYVSEIWYRRDNSAVKPIIKTPRLKIKYGARRFSNEAPYTYCLSLYNRDIDPEIEQFYKIIRDFDQCVIQTYNDRRRAGDAQWQLPNIASKYWSAMRRRDSGDEYYLQVKLITEDSKVLTIMHNEKRESCTPEDIKYGLYSDQYISPAYIIYNKEGIHPIWHAHQLVISGVEKIFLTECLLDQILPAPSPSYTQAPYNIPLPPPPPPGPGFADSTPVIASSKQHALSHIKVTDIREAMKKLRRANIEPIPETLPLCYPITDEVLRSRRAELKQ